MHNKKNKKKSKILGNLLLIGSLFMFLTYFDLRIDKSSNSLITDNGKNIYTNVSASELINVLDKETGAIIIVNNKKDINRIISILLDINDNNNIFVYNAKNDEIVISKENGKLKEVQKASVQYQDLINKLGAYSEKYIIEGEDTHYYKINTPTVLFVKEGSIKYSYYINDSSDENSLANIYKFGFSMLRSK